MTPARSVARELGMIVALSLFLGLIYNAFSSRGIPLVRKTVEKVAVPDSILFGKGGRPSVSIDSGGPSHVTVIAPLHERALRAQDSMARVEASEKKKSAELVRIISLEQLRRLLADGHNVLLDARDADGYRKGHIPGARSMPGLEAQDHFDQLATIPRDTLVVIYCNNPECHLGRMLGEFMSALGFTNLTLYDDGWDGWVKARLPIDSSGGGRTDGR